MRLRFLGAAQQVTGSCYALEAGGLTVLVDCGLYQERSYLERNWNPFPIPPGDVDFLLLTHAHIDHSGLIPRLVRQGFSGPILTTSATADLLPIVLMDAANLQQEDAAYKMKRHQKEGRKGAHPEIPLYTVEDVNDTLPLVQEVDYARPVPLNSDVSVRFLDAGHILGSAMIEITCRLNGSARRIIFSGDIGQWNKPLIKDPTLFSQADYIVMESTYGDRDHEDTKDVDELLCDIISRTVRSRGNVVIPTFAIERAQELVFYLSRMSRSDCIPPVMYFLDSPMAVDVTEVFGRHPECLDRETLALFRERKSPFAFSGFKSIRTIEESKAVNNIKGSCVIMAGSGMCTGGRIKQHLVHNISRPESTVLFVGYQAKETLGRQILDGQTEVRIYGQIRPVRARVEKILGFSAHADRQALFRWLNAFAAPPRRLFLTHGEREVPLRLAADIRRDKGWETAVPEYLASYDLN